MASDYPFTNNPYAQQNSGYANYQQNDSNAHLLSNAAPSASASPSTANLLDARYGPSARAAAPAALRPRTADMPPGSALGAASTSAHSISDKFSLSPDPRSWGANLSMPEADDDLHNPDPRRDRKNDQGGTIFTARGLANLGCLFILAVGIVTLFAGYPLITYFTKHDLSFLGGFNIGGTNASGQVPSFIGNWGLIDKDTPQSAYTIPSYKDGSKWELVFSDEFNTEGRSFYPGDDPYWEAVDLWYWATGDLEWDDPKQITTRNGSLEITMSKTADHGLNFTGGMVTTWNKFCFTGGMYLASVSLPGVSDISGFWPALWSLGNLGRAGYGATLDGLWPYSYDACDVGTVANQSTATAPSDRSVLQYPDPYSNPKYELIPLSFLPGQRLSRCTCAGESHPGPMHSDGTFVGRGAPEIDMFEAQIKGTPLSGQVSQSAQWAPFNYNYEWLNNSANLAIANPDVTILNSYMGSDLQQATSAVTNTNQDCYTGPGMEGCYETYGFEYMPGFDDAYISWIATGALAWTMQVGGMAADSRTEISARPIAQEPMYLIANLGMSPGFEFVDIPDLIFPAVMRVDWIRVYQDPSAKNIGCDPPDFPTAAYINQYIEAYTNQNLTTWVKDYGQTIPKNSFLGQC